MDTVNAEVRKDIDRDLATLLEVEAALWEEYKSGTLTTAQKIGALSEIRRVVQLRGWVLGYVPPVGATGQAD